MARFNLVRPDRRRYYFRAPAAGIFSPRLGGLRPGGIEFGRSSGVRLACDARERRDEMRFRVVADWRVELLIPD